MRNAGELWTKAEYDLLTEKIIGAAIEAHKGLGPGLMESSYEECLSYELDALSIPFRRQIHMPIQYKAITLSKAYKVDMIVSNAVLLELKAVEKILPLHEAQVRTYLKLSEFECALLINFNEIMLKDGIRRFNKTNPVHSLGSLRPPKAP